MLERGMRMLGVGLILILCLIHPAQAIQWQQVAVSPEGNMRQYIDADSVRKSGHFVTIASYVELDKTSGTEIETYVTEYDCEQERFRDLQSGASPNEIAWKTIEADPLNEAARVSACSM